MNGGPGKFYVETKFQVQALTNTVIPAVIKSFFLSSQKLRLYLGKNSGSVFGGTWERGDGGSRCVGSTGHLL